MNEHDWMSWHYEPVPPARLGPTPAEVLERERFRSELRNALALMESFAPKVEPAVPVSDPGSPLGSSGTDLGTYTDVSTTGKVLDL